MAGAPTDITQLSDADLEALHTKGAPNAADITRLSDDDLNRLAVPHAQSPHDAASASGHDAGASLPGWAQTADATAHAYLPFANYVAAGVRYAGQRLLGIEHPDDFSTDLAFARGMDKGESGVGPTIGSVAGTVGQAVTGGKALSVIGDAAPILGKTLAALSPVKGRPIYSLFKSGAVNAGIGGSTALASGDTPQQSAVAAGVSAVGGPALGKVIEYGGAKLAGASAAAMRVLADKFNEQIPTLQAAMDSFTTLTGSVPSMAQLAALKTQGLLRSLAAANSTIGDAANKAANAAGAPYAEQQGRLMQARQLANAAGVPLKPQTSSDIIDSRNRTMDAAMNMPHPQTGVPLRDVPVPDPQGLLQDPMVEFALKPNARTYAGQGQTSPVLDNIQNGQQTISDVEATRQALRNVQSTFLRPSNPQFLKDPTLAKQYGDHASKIEGLGAAADPDYGKSLKLYRFESDYNDGFNHGFTTDKAFNDTSDDITKGAMTRPGGVAGYEHGRALRVGQSALDAIAPAVVNPQASLTGSHVAQGAMAAQTGGIGAVYHAMRAIPGLHYSDAAQQRLAQKLFDPAETAGAVRALQQAGVDAQHIRQMGAAAGGALSARIGSILGSNGAQ